MLRVVFIWVILQLLEDSPLLLRHNGRDGISNHQPHDCLLSRLSRPRSKKTSKLRVTGLCAGNSPATGEFPAQMASNPENICIWWRHHDIIHSPMSFQGCFISADTNCPSVRELTLTYLGLIDNYLIPDKPRQQATCMHFILRCAVHNTKCRYTYHAVWHFSKYRFYLAIAQLIFNKWRNRIYIDALQFKSMS